MESYNTNYKKELKSVSKKMEQYTERNKKEKVVKGKAMLRKKSGVTKLSDAFLSDDVNNIKNYILMDVVVPAIKNTIYDVISNSTGTINDAIRDGIHMMLWGEADRNKHKSNIREYTPYSGYYKKESRPVVRSWAESRGYNNGEVILKSRGEAEFVLDQMDELIDTYSTVSVADLYDLVGIEANYTDNKYGWTDIRSAKVVSTREGYLLKLPKALPLD